MTPKDRECTDPLDPSCMSSLRHWGGPLPPDIAETMAQETVVDCGWGRLLFGQTFTDPQTLATELVKEQKGRRDLALYVREPHVVISHAPQELFLDPSHTYRLDFRNYHANVEDFPGFQVRALRSDDDESTINGIYQAWGMVPSYPGFYRRVVADEAVEVLVAEDRRSGQIIGAVTGVDHRLAFNDPDNGSSLWALAVDQQSQLPKVGEALVRSLIEVFLARERRFLDLSVMHSNSEAIGLYAKLGFAQVPVYCLKKRNSINEPLFIGHSQGEEDLNIYASIITDEARRRGIGVEILDGKRSYFRLYLGSRSIICRESLSELTSAIALSRCDDKSLTRSILAGAGLRLPAQKTVSHGGDPSTFLKAHGRVVVKPARGEQGAGVFVDLRTTEEVEKAITKASALCETVLLEEFVEGHDVRIIVIDDQVVAAAVRNPPVIRGTGHDSIGRLIERQSRRRSAATHGESAIPMDDETLRTISRAGYDLEDILPEGEELTVRKTANLHTGGTIHDLTPSLHPALKEAAVTGAKALDIPVVGFDFLVPDLTGPEYVIIEANERPGLANHEPQPTAARFVDLLFPQTRTYTSDSP